MASQSDFIKYKKVNTVLALDASTNFAPVLNSQDYSNYRGFVFQNTVPNTKTIYNRITESTKQVVLDMDKDKSSVENMGITITNCPSFLLCTETETRPYRVPLSESYFTPTPQPLNWRETKNASWKKTGCKCIMNSSNTNANICSCKLGK
jgi:hypothetical protein